MPHKKLLILGGTSEAAELARQCVQRFGGRLDVTVSYSGITGHQPDLPCHVRVGGFGGAPGLIKYMEDQAIDYLIDATHPFAEKISYHAYVASMAMEKPTLVFIRLGWAPTPKDHWLEVPDMESAARTVEEWNKPTFLTIGVKELSKFDGLVDTSLFVRMLKEPEEELPLSTYEVITGRPPFSVEEERSLLREKKIKVLVTKNSGGDKTQNKLIAAREENVAVIMIDRPLSEPLDHVATIEEVLGWLQVHGA